MNEITLTILFAITFSVHVIVIVAVAFCSRDWSSWRMFFMCQGW